jgi:hypothetical protein
MQAQIHTVPSLMPTTSTFGINTPDELTSTVCNAIQSLSQVHKAHFLLDTAVALIEAGK